MQESEIPAEEIKNEELEFTYNLGDKFKIDIEAAKKRKEARELESKKNFEELKKQMEESAKLTPVV
jgi:ribosomal protein S1